MLKLTIDGAGLDQRRPLAGGDCGHHDALAIGRAEVAPERVVDVIADRLCSKMFEKGRVGRRDREAWGSDWACLVQADLLLAIAVA